MKTKIEYVLNNLEVIKRGETEIVVVKDGAPEIIKDLIREVHGTNFLPDDFRFSKIYEILDTMLSYDCDNLEEVDHEIVDGLVDIYTHNLNNWLSSNLLRSSYCDDAQYEGLVGENTTMNDRIMVGQYQEINELYHNLLSELEELDIEELTEAV